MGKCKGAYGFSDTADMVKDFSPLFRRQREYFSLDIDFIEKQEDDFLQKCWSLETCIM